MSSPSRPFYPTAHEVQAEADAKAARDLVASALDRRSDLFRFHGPDILLAAAQVYATLARR